MGDHCVSLDMDVDVVLGSEEQFEGAAGVCADVFHRLVASLSPVYWDGLVRRRPTQEVGGGGMRHTNNRVDLRVFIQTCHNVESGPSFSRSQGDLDVCPETQIRRRVARACVKPSHSRPASDISVQFFYHSPRALCVIVAAHVLLHVLCILLGHQPRGSFLRLCVIRAGPDDQKTICCLETVEPLKRRLS